MKSSKYNIFLENGDNILAYNSRTSALAEVSYNQYDKIKKYLGVQMKNGILNLSKICYMEGF